MILYLSFQVGCKSVFTVEEYNSSRELISYGDSVVVFTTNQKEEPRLKASRLYYYYNLQEIHASRGAYIGKLLDKKFIKQDKRGALLEAGFFKSGLKHGQWKRWHDNGELETIERWWNGRGVQRKKVFDEFGDLAGEYRWKDNRWASTKRIKRKRAREIKREDKRVQEEEISAMPVNKEKGKLLSFFSLKKSRKLKIDPKPPSEKEEKKNRLRSRQSKKSKEEDGVKTNRDWFNIFKRKNQDAE